MAYIDTNHNYTDPEAYDARSSSLLEKYNKRAWDPVIYKTGKEYISSEDTVCDFGCGTLAHIDAMQQAKKIYAIDINEKMLAAGLAKAKEGNGGNNIIPIIADAKHTPIPNRTCSVIWSIGLTEYTDLDALFHEMTRVSTARAHMLLQFPSAHNPLHLAIRILNRIRGRKTKRFRTLQEIRGVSKKYGWQITRVQSAFIRNNLWCVLRKSTDA